MAVLSARWIGVAALVATGCLGTTPQEQEPAVQGDYDDGDEEHRPGQPCLLCHGLGHLREAPGGDIFAVAGTVYSFVDDDEDSGLEGVDVTVTDFEGDTFVATSNPTGNFMFDVDTGLSAPRVRDEGRTTMHKEPVYPLEVSIERGPDLQEMKTKIWRAGSCAHCHGPSPDASSVGRVFLFERVP